MTAHPVRTGTKPSALWQRYVAIGDSFTEGMSDPDPQRPDAYIGWADRLALNLAEQNAQTNQTLQYANLAVRGRLLDDVVGPQLDAALALQPDLVSMVGGGNDIMRPKVDLDGVAARLETAVERIRATGADVLLATMVNPTGLGMIGRLTPRISFHIANLWGIAQRHNCYVLDVWGMHALRDPRMWGVDRLHLSTEGHTRVAAQAAWTLGLPTQGDWRAPLPPLEPLKRAQKAREDAQWAREYFGPWVQRRIKGTSSGDGRSPKRPDLAPVTLDD